MSHRKCLELQRGQVFIENHKNKIVSSIQDNGGVKTGQRITDNTETGIL